MKIEYKYVTGETVEIEVSEEWSKILIELDRQEYNINHKETRRHVYYGASCDDGEWLADESLNPEVLIQEKEEAAKCESAFRSLTEEQSQLIKRVYEDHIGITAYAKECGITQQAVSKRVKTIRRKMKKVLD